MNDDEHREAAEKMIIDAVANFTPYFGDKTSNADAEAIMDYLDSARVAVFWLKGS